MSVCACKLILGFLCFFQLDLRSIGAPGVSSDVARNLEHSLEGQPLVLQLQKVKNVAVPSTKQLLPSPSKRLLRLQLTDGHTTLSAVETEGPQRGLRYACVCGYNNSQAFQ